MAVLLAFVVLIILVYKKVPAALAAVVSAVLMCILAGLDVLGVMKGEFMEAAANFAKSYFLLFLLCSIYAAAMDASGAAYSIGKWLANILGPNWAIWGVSIASFVLTYGGISAFVIIFAMYPIALVLFKEADISRKMIPGVIGAGAFTVPNYLWGSPGVCNVIPGEYLGTTVRSAPLVSVIVSIFVFLICNLYLVWKNKRNHKKGVGFVPTEKIQKLLSENENRSTVNPVLALIPLAVIIIVLNVLKLDVLIAVLCGIVAAYALFWKRIDNKLDTFVIGTQNGVNATMGTAPIVGLGNVAKLTPFFQTAINATLNMKGNPLVSWALGCTVITALVGSGSGGAMLSCELLAEQYLAMGLNPEILHRICTCAVVVFDSLPWNGVMCTMLAVCDLSHKDGYGDLFMVSVVCNGLGLILCTMLGVMLY